MSYIDLDLVEPGLAISGSVQAITVDEQRASVGAGLSVNCAVEAIAAFDLNASVIAPRVVNALAESVLSESRVSSVLTEVLDSFVDLDFIEPVALVVDAATESIAVQANTASLSTSRTVSGSLESVSVSANSATVGAGLLVPAVTASILSESLLSAVLTAVLDSFVDLEFPDPIPLVVDAATESVAVQANAASLSAARTVACAVEAISLTAHPAAIGAGRLVAANSVGVLSESLVSAVLTAVLESFVDLEFPDPIPLEVNAATEAIAVQSGVASLDTIRNVDCAVESISVTAAAASISAGRSITASAASVLVESLVSSVLTEILDSFIDLSTIDPRVVDAAIEAISVTANPATIGAGLSVTASAASVLAESLVSAVLTEILDSYIDLDLVPPDSLTVEAHTASIGVSGQPATVQVLRLVECSTESVGVSTGVASVGTGRAPMLSLVGVSVAALGAELGIARDVDCATASATIYAFPAAVTEKTPPASPRVRQQLRRVARRATRRVSRH